MQMPLQGRACIALVAGALLVSGCQNGTQTTQLEGGAGTGGIVGALGGALGGAALGGAIGAGVGVALGPRILASRAFAGPTQYPPSQFAAYGIVAFTSRAMSDDLPRYHMICNAYIASLLSYKEVPAPIKSQMVTVWPVETDSAADRINAMIRNDKLCEKAVDSYGLMTALIAIDDAKHSHAELDGLGPFLLAWSPSGQKGRPDALVLVSNLSDVTTFEQAKLVFLQWSHDIVENPDLWEKGWNKEKLKVTIRLWADKYGPKILKIFGGSE